MWPRLRQASGDDLRLVLWKLRVLATRFADRRLGGHARRVARGARWADTWRSHAGNDATALARWRSRPEALHLWLPTDALAWASTTCTEADVQCADRAIRGEFDLLGSGPVGLGDPPAWRRDLYSGVEWPLAALDYRAVLRRDGSDIRTVWELSRCRHFLALARAYASTHDVRYRDAFVRHVTSFIADNPMGRGPHWLSPMDAGIRAANWILSAEIFSRDAAIPASFWASVLANLHATADFVDRHLEWHPVYRGNHYVANGISLLYLGVFFGGTADGRRWSRLGADILESEIRYQVTEDGVGFEASLAYHRLVTEFFAFGWELLQRNASLAPSAAYTERLRAMFAFIAAYSPQSGLAPMLGDADDGRLHAVDAVAEREPRRHRLGLPEGHWPTSPPAAAAFPRGGFYVLRNDDDHLIVRCGTVGLRGAGSHDHNDQLSIELCIRGRRVVADSGTFTYTRDLGERFVFRSTAAHSVPQIDDEEQNPISPDRPWRVLADRTQSRCVQWVVGPDRQLFEGVHHGFAHRTSGAVCHRRIELESSRHRWTIVDRLEGHGTESVTWRMHLSEGPVTVVRRNATTWQVRLPGEPDVLIEIALPPTFELTVMPSPASDRYGVRYERPSLIATGRGALPLRFTTSLWPDS